MINTFDKQAVDLASVAMLGQALWSDETSLILLLNVDGTILDLNAPMAARLGKPATSLKGSPFWCHLSPECQLPHQDLFQKVLQTRLPQQIEHPCEGRWLESILRPCLAPSGDLLAVALTITDVTERKGAEERLFQSQKMDAIGHLAGGMAHAFNNYLAAIHTGLGLLQMGKFDPESQIVFRRMEDLSHKAATVIKQLLAFSRKSMMQVEPLDWIQSVELQRETLSRLLGDSITLEFSAPERLPRISADPSLIDQVLLNLCQNAKDAMPDGGALRLALSLREVSTKQARAAGDFPPGKYVCLSVTDTGCGMSDSVMQQLFEPFFTTKDIGEGTGLGLATARGIVQQLHGWIEVQSQIGIGSTFTVFLPALPDTVGAASAPSQPPPRLGTATILFIEDDASLRMLTRMALCIKGYSVLEAGNADEALAVWKKHRHEINLVLSDVALPGELNGIQLTERLIGECPGLQVILTSGYNIDWTASMQSRPDSIICVPKPYPLETLLSAIRQCLSRI